MYSKGNVLALRTIKYVLIIDSYACNHHMAHTSHLDSFRFVKIVIMFSISVIYFLHTKTRGHCQKMCHAVLWLFGFMLHRQQFKASLEM